MVRGGRVATQIQAAGGFEDAMQFHQTRRHHRRIFEEGMPRFHHFHDGGVWAVVHELAVSVRRVRPIPRVRERVKLRLTRLAGRLAEQDVVIRIGIERRVEINEVNARVGKNFHLPQPLQIVAEKKAVHC